MEKNPQVPRNIPDIPEDRETSDYAPNTLPMSGEYNGDAQSLDSASDVAHEPTDEIEDYERTRGKAMSAALLQAVPQVEYSDPADTASEKAGVMSDYWKLLVANDDAGKYLSDEDEAFYSNPNNYEPEKIDEHVAKKRAEDPNSHLPCI